jgi:sugar lactone lactonase YvrE
LSLEPGGPGARQAAAPDARRRWPKGLAGLLVVALGVLLSCQAKPPGVLFPPLAGEPLRWPAAPNSARIYWEGQLARDTDLKPGVNGMEAFGQALFGKGPARGMVKPYALCTDGHDRLFVADPGAQAIHVFDLAKRKYAIWKPGKKQPALVYPVAVLWDAGAGGAGDGRLLVSDSVAGALVVFDATGKYAGQIGTGVLKRPCGLALEPGTRRIVVADVMAHQVVILESDGKLAARVGQRGTALGEFNYPTSVAFDSQHRLYVCDALNFRVQLLDAAYKPLRIFGQKGDMPGCFGQPKAVAVDPEDHVYVVDGQFENVQVFDQESHVLMDFGEEGRDPGKFWLPTGIFIEPTAEPGGPAGGAPSGHAARIWVADSYNQRVQLFEYRPLAPETRP